MEGRCQSLPQQRLANQIFKISRDTHREFLKYLKEHQDDFWIATFSEAMDYLADPQKHSSRPPTSF